MSREDPEGPEPEREVGDGPFPAEPPGSSESPGENPDRPLLGPRLSLFFASLDSTMEGLQQRAQDLLNRINDSRKEDHTMLSGFKDNLLLKVSELAEQLEESLFQSYAFHNRLMQERLQALAEVMQRLEELQAELHRISCTVEAVYEDLCLQPEA